MTIATFQSNFDAEQAIAKFFTAIADDASRTDVEAFTTETQTFGGRLALIATGPDREQIIEVATAKTAPQKMGELLSEIYCQKIYREKLGKEKDVVGLLAIYQGSGESPQEVFKAAEFCDRMGHDDIPVCQAGIIQHGSEMLVDVTGIGEALRSYGEYFANDYKKNYSPRGVHWEQEMERMENGFWKIKGDQNNDQN